MNNNKQTNSLHLRDGKAIHTNGMQHLEVNELLLDRIAQIDVLVEEQVFLEQKRVMLLRLLLRGGRSEERKIVWLG